VKTFATQSITLLAIALASQTGLAVAGDFHWVGDGPQMPAPPSVEKALRTQERPPVVPNAPAGAPVYGYPNGPCGGAAYGCPTGPCGGMVYGCPNGPCGGAACGNPSGPCGATTGGNEEPCDVDDCCPCHLGCDEECKSLGVVGFIEWDAFKGISDGYSTRNFGAASGVNAGALLPGLGDYGLGWQSGASYGVYDWDGRNPTAVIGVDQARTQQQIFVTTGFFRKAACGQRLSFGLVYDWMFNEEWGEAGTRPTLGQWRGQIEYAISGRNAIGVWGCRRDLSDQETHRDPNLFAFTATTRAISQINLFWHHKFCSGADSNIWFGIPDHGRLDGDGSLLDWTVGANLQVPLSQRLAVYANAAYFHPSDSAGSFAAIESGYDMGVGIVWYIGGGACSHAINGPCATPYMPLANNSNFLVDQNVRSVFPTVGR
jgi:hypothetical protein